MCKYPEKQKCNRKTNGRCIDCDEIADRPGSMVDYAYELALSSKECHEHAAACQSCSIPIIDDEGNPGYLSEACGEGRRILAKYMRIENAILEFAEEDESDEVCPICGDPDCRRPWTHSEED
jgi:hypothetical protein